MMLFFGWDYYALVVKTRYLYHASRRLTLLHKYTVVRFITWRRRRSTRQDARTNISCCRCCCTLDYIFLPEIIRKEQEVGL